MKILPVLVMIFVITSCHSRTEPAHETARVFCLPDSLASKITVDTVSVQQVTDEFNLAGKITYDEDKVVKIYPLVSGFVTAVKVTLGDQVGKGQVLALIRSTEMSSAENDLVTANSNLALAEKNLSATEDLYRGGIASEKEYLAARTDVEKAKSELEKARTVLEIYGGTRSMNIIKSPVNGYIVEKNINPGMQIRPDNSGVLFTIADLKQVWVLANAYETDVSVIKPGEKARITTLGYPGRVFEGVIDKVNNVLDPEDKTMKVRIQLANPDLLLKPEMSCTINIKNVTDRRMLAVPANSVLFERNKYWVVVYKGNCDIRARQIVTEGTSGKYTYIISGAERGEKVLTSYQLIIYNALSQ